MAILAIFIAMLLDPVHWLVCGLSGWFIKKLPLAIGIGVAIMLGASLALKIGGSEIAMAANAAASAFIVYIFHIWQKKRESKTNNTNTTAVADKGEQ
ncbi:hypothetical protein P2Q70_21105 [Pseudomonas mendocina]|uniref:hypothetical protein n=1 Tax=Ectopseudomonas mendocina TaxID=300 RepID=UPI0023DC3242|nr:hypothetical protein [Pseudomonas mendocina]MDF2077094.1 hypothetical protein [Pseudomonas mendocina]